MAVLEGQRLAPDVPVVIITPRNGQRGRGDEEGGFDFIIKPFKLDG